MPILAADFEDLDATGSSSSSSNGSDVACIGDEEGADDSAGLLCVCNADLCNSYRERVGGDRTG